MITQKESKYNTFVSSFRINDRIAAAILSGDDKTAAAVLSAYGKITCIPALDDGLFTTKEEIARFYGVDVNYLHGVLLRCGIKAQTAPGLAIRFSNRDSLYEFCSKHRGMTRCLTNDGVGVCDTSKPNMPKFTILYDKAPHTVLYSVKVALALAAIMPSGRYTPENSVAGTVLKGLMRSPYFEEAERTKPPISKEAEEEEEKQSETPIEPEETTNVTINMTPEILTQLVETTVAEAVSAVWEKLLETDFSVRPRT